MVWWVGLGVVGLGDGRCVSIVATCFSMMAELLWQWKVGALLER